MAAIEVEHLYKTFRIPHEKRTTLFEALTGVFKPPAVRPLGGADDQPRQGGGDSWNPDTDGGGWGNARPARDEPPF